MNGITVDYSKILNKMSGLQNDLKKVVVEVANGCLNECVSNSPVDSGYLKSQWRQNKVSDYLQKISNNTEYILCQEYGTKYNHKNAGFTRNSIDRYRPIAIKQIKAAMK